MEEGVKEGDEEGYEEGDKKEEEGKRMARDYLCFFFLHHAKTSSSWLVAGSCL